MSITVKIEGESDASGGALEAPLTSVSRAALETLALKGYRSGELTGYQIRQMPGFETLMEVDGFLKAHGVTFDYSEEEFERDARVSREASSKHRSF